LHRFRGILFKPMAGHVHIAHVRLRLGIALIGQRLKQFNGRGPVTPVHRRPARLKRPGYGRSRNEQDDKQEDCKSHRVLQKGRGIISNLQEFPANTLYLPSLRLMIQSPAHDISMNASFMKKTLLALPIAAIGAWLAWQFGTSLNSDHASLMIAA